MSIAGQTGAIGLLARLLAAIPDPTLEGIGVGEIVEAQAGVSAELLMPSGDRYVVVVQWIGDRESS